MKIFKSHSLLNSAQVKQYFIEKGHWFKDYIDTFGLEDKEIRKFYSIINPKRPEYKELKEIPIGITEDSTIVCIPYLRDAPKFGNFGMTGFGKTAITKTLIDRLYWYWNHRFALMNDYLAETPIWTTPMETMMFINKLKLLYEHPISLPIVPMIPKGKSRSEYLIRENIPRVEFNLGFQDFIDYINDFISDLAGSEKYFKNLDWSNCYKDNSTMQDFKNTLDGLPLYDEFGKPNKGINAVKEKISNIVNMFINEGILSLEKDRLTKISDGKETENPFIMVMKYGGIPSLISSRFVTKDYYIPVFRSIADNITEYQDTNPEFRKERLYFFVEELSKILKLRKGRDNQAINKIIEIVQQGRYMNIGAIINSQNYSDVPDQITSNINYSFMFQSSSDEDIKKFCKDNGLIRKNYTRKINNLERHEFIAVTKDYFKTYNLITGEDDKVESPMECRTIPPLSNMISSDKVAEWNTQKKKINESNIFFNKLSSKNIQLINPTTKEKINEIKKETRFFKWYNPDPPLPMIIEHLDLSLLYYPKKRYKKIVGYEFLLNKNKYVFHDKIKDFYFLMNGNTPTRDSVPLDELPKGIHLYANFKSRNVRLIGRKCSPKVLSF